MRLNHNMASYSIFRTQTKILASQNKALSNISSGYKINGAKDDPYGLVKSEKDRMQIRGLQVASQNIQDAVGMLQTAEGGLNEMTSVVQRIKELAVQAGNGSMSSSDKVIAQKEISQLLKGVNDIARNTRFNGISILASPSTATGTNISIPIGANTGEKVSIDTYKLELPVPPETAGSSLSALYSIDVTTPTGANSSYGVIDASLDTIISARSKFGAIENRLESGLSNNSALSYSFEKSDSSIRDADLAQEMMEYSKDGVLSEAANALLVQTNRFPQEILKILQNVK